MQTQVLRKQAKKPKKHPSCSSHFDILVVLQVKDRRHLSIEEVIYSYLGGKGCKCLGAELGAATPVTPTVSPCTLSRSTKLVVSTASSSHRRGGQHLITVPLWEAASQATSQSSTTIKQCLPLLEGQAALGSHAK